MWSYNRKRFFSELSKSITMSQRIKDKTLFGWLRNIFKQGDDGVHNDHHESLSDEDKIVEDFIEVGKFIVKRL